MTKLSLEKTSYSFHFNILKYLGAWVVDPSNPFLLKAYAIYKTMMTIMAATACFSLFADFYMVFGDFKKMTWNLCVTALFAGSVLKNFFIFPRSNVINGLRIKLHRDASSGKTPEENKVNRSSLKELKFVQIVFYGTAAVSVTAWIVSRYLSYLWGPRDIPIPFRLPIKLDLEDDFEYNYVFCIIAGGGIVGITLVLETELAMFTILIQIAREYQKLLNNISKINELYEDCATRENHALQEDKKHKQEVNPWLRRRRTKVLVKEYCIRQQKLIEYTEDFELGYSSSMLLQIFVLSILVIVSAIQCILEYESFLVNLSYQLGYIIVLVLDIFLVCWYITRIREQCFKVGEEAYSVLWYCMSVDIQKDISMIIMRSQRPPRITSGKIMEMNLRAFMLVMRNIYSWLALFKQLEFKGNG